jgi:predicted anti-sigma-YlaC factor YlaD
MNRCDDIRVLFSAVLEREATEDEAARVVEHTRGCPECAELFETMSVIVDSGDHLAELDPPAQLGSEIADSPCRRWLGLLYQAVDRDISQHNLERLFGHLEQCESCRQVWYDMTLIHQVGEVMQPPGHLVYACIQVRNAVRRIAILPRRTATAAAYVLALLASLAIGNPTIVAQDLQASAAEQMSRAATGVSEVAASGRGEARVALWRVLRWGETRIDTARSWLGRLTGSDDATADSDGPVEGSQTQGDTT